MGKFQECPECKKDGVSIPLEELKYTLVCNFCELVFEKFNYSKKIVEYSQIMMLFDFPVLP